MTLYRGWVAWIGAALLARIPKARIMGVIAALLLVAAGLLSSPG